MTNVSEYMGEGEKPAYERLSCKLAVDPLTLDDDLIELPTLIQETAEWTSRAMLRRDISANDLEIAKAAAGKTIRESSEKKPPEDAIKDMKLLDLNVQDHMMDYEEAKYTFSIWMALMEAMRAKAHSIEGIGKLIASAYMSPSSLYEKQRNKVFHRDARPRPKANE